MPTISTTLSLIRIRVPIVATLLLALGLAAPAQALILDQPMTGATAPGWVIGGAAYLTASTGADTPGNGWLRLTEPFNDQSGFAMYDSAFDISQGVVIQFDYATWGGTGADGYSIYLFDGAYNAATFQVGASGGSLGYDKKTVAPVAPGVTGGYIGVGIDEYGNFSNPTEGRLGGPGLRQNSVAVRGPFDHPSGAYYYIGGTAANVGTLWFNQAFRPGQLGTQYRKVVIYLTPVSAPEYMRVDVFMQFGYNQPLTYLINTLYTMRPIPSTVKVGYAASTGGSTNYHEIRNLAIDNLPTDINLAIAKSASAPIVAPGGALTYTVTARNYGPNLVTIANNVPIVDTLPAELTGATWTCAGSGGGNCDAASGSGNLNTTADLPFNGAATYTITGTVAGALGTVFTNTATLSAPAGITDYNPADDSASVATTISNGNITISGTVYNDSGAGGGIAHNGVRDGTEGGVNVGLTYYAKLFRPTDLTTTVVAPVTVNAATGIYTMNNVPGYGDYVVILSSTNTANVYDPSFPSANWIYVAPLNYTLTGLVANGVNLTNQNFFVYNGSRISGKVIKDDGFNGSISTAYDGILNAAETGIAGVTVRLANNTGGTTYDTTTTDSNGTFVLFTNTASANLRIYETNLPAYTSVSWNDGSTNGAYTIGGEYIQFAYTLYTDYVNVLFGDIPPPVTISFTPTPQSASGTPAAPVYLPHTFTSTARGSVSFAMNNRTQGTWPAVSFVRDLDCDGNFDVGEPDIIAAINIETAENLCILVRETIPAGATPGTTDAITTRATFTYGLATLTADVVDTTTVANYPAVSATKTWIDTNNGDHDPGDTIRYTITLTETNNSAASNVSVTDTINANYDTFTIVSIPSGAVDSSTPGSGPLDVTNISIPAGGSVSIVYTVKIVTGTSAGTSIPNTANFVNPGGMSNGTAVATNVIVSASSIPGSGNKQLYLHDATSTPAYKLSRTPMTVNAANYVAILRGPTTRAWVLSPALASPVTIDNGIIPVRLWLASNTTRTYTIPVELYCGATRVAFLNTGTAALVAGALAAPFNFNLPLGADYTCPTGSAWELRVTNSEGGTGTARQVRVFPAPSANNYSNVSLSSQNVINVDSVIPYSAPYNDMTSPASYAAGSTVHLRAVVSDPFGSDDINVNNDATTLPRITITDRDGNATNLAMTEVNNSGAATKTFEFDYAIPGGGLAGYWTASVTAPEGTEGTVADTGVGTFLVTVPAPNLTVVKYMTSDPTTPYNIPGGLVTYTIDVTNSGDGATDDDSVIIIDPIPTNTALIVTPPAVTYNPVVANGLTFTYASDVTFSQFTTGLDFTYVPTADANGTDVNVKRLRINPQGPLNGAASAPYPRFTVSFKIRIN